MRSGARISCATLSFLCLVRSADFVCRANAQDSDETLRPFAVDVVRVPKENWTGKGVYLGKGLVLTAGHVAGAFIHTVHVEVAGLDLPTEVLKRGQYSPTDDSAIDLALLAVDDTKLPLSLRLRSMRLCEKGPEPGEEVLVATPERIARSHVVSPNVIPRGISPKFRTSIADVATTGDSGSGVFDAQKLCLLGIVSAKITVKRRVSNKGPVLFQAIDIAKYFVPAPIIRQFMPAEYRF
jgi:hypothetical protein